MDIKDMKKPETRTLRCPFRSYDVTIDTESNSMSFLLGLVMADGDLARNVESFFDAAREVIMRDESATVDPAATWESSFSSVVSHEYDDKPHQSADAAYSLDKAAHALDYLNA